MHTNSKLLFEKHALPYFTAGMRILEIGPDTSPSNYQKLVTAPVASWDTVDFPRDFATTYTLSEEYHFPIDSESYDLVLSGQVIEHVRKIWVWLQEVARVVKPGGLVITINPVSWPYHEAPVDCWRIYPEGMRALYDDAGLDVIASVCESLEAIDYNRVIPGRSQEWQEPELRRLTWLMDKLRLPIECAFDTATVGRKR